MRDYTFYETEQDALAALEQDNSLEALVIIPDTDGNGKMAYRIGTWDEYRRAIEDTVGFLYEPLNPDYTGEDPDELVKLYGYTRQFAEDVCEEIDRIIAENKEEQDA